MKLAIGLTGGIGSGKSTAADMFSEFGVDIIDADEVARELVANGSKVLTAIVEHFGKSILLPSGDLNRSIMRQAIFEDLNAKLWLEKLMHPLIRERMNQMLAFCKSPYIVLVVPLLLETTEDIPFIKRVLVVDAPQEMQISRTEQRDASEISIIHKIVQAQIPRDQRLARADDIIENAGDLLALQQQVRELHKKYLHLAHLSS